MKMLRVGACKYNGLRKGCVPEGREEGLGKDNILWENTTKLESREKTGCVCSGVGMKDNPRDSRENIARGMSTVPPIIRVIPVSNSPLSPFVGCNTGTGIGAGGSIRGLGVLASLEWEC